MKSGRPDQASLQQCKCCQTRPGKIPTSTAKCSMRSLSLIRSIYQTQRTMVVSIMGHMHTSSRHQTLHASHRTPVASSLFHIHPTAKKYRGAAVSHALRVLGTQGVHPCRMNLYGPFPGQRRCRWVGVTVSVSEVQVSVWCVCV